ncbi:MAG: A24 family peptidase [Hyphomicrobiaceae bacterium]
MLGVFEYSLLLLFPAFMALAAMLDLFTMTIPNRISLFLVAAFCVVAPVTGMGWEQFAIHFGVGAAVLVAGFLLFALGFLGGGDAKLLAAASLWIGYHDLLSYLVIVAQFGAVLAIAILVYRRMIPAHVIPNQAWTERLHNKKQGIPYGIALACGALWVFPQTEWFFSVAV